MSNLEKRTLGKALKEYRERAGLTQLQLAVRAEVSMSVVANVEADRTVNPGLSSLRKIVRILKLNPLEILDLYGWTVHNDDFDKNRPLLLNRYEEHGNIAKKPHREGDLTITK